MPLFALSCYIVGAAFAHGGVVGNRAHVVGVVPAAFAFFAAAGSGGYGQFAAGLYAGGGDQKGEAQLVAEGFEVACRFFGGSDVDFGL